MEGLIATRRALSVVKTFMLIYVCVVPFDFCKQPVCFRDASSID
jgi:hypothetical protein